MLPIPFIFQVFVPWRKAMKEKTNWHNYAPWSECLSHTPSTLPGSQRASNLMSKELFGRCLQSFDLPGGQIWRKAGTIYRVCVWKAIQMWFQGTFQGPVFVASGDTRPLKLIHGAASNLEKGLQSRSQKIALVYGTLGALPEMPRKASVSKRVRSYPVLNLTSTGCENHCIQKASMDIIQIPCGNEELL